MNLTCDFCTYCHPGDVERLHAPGQLQKQVESNKYPFDNVIVIHQRCDFNDYPDFNTPFNVKNISIADENEMDDILSRFNINKPQAFDGTKYYWKYLTVNYLRAIEEVTSEYVVMADADCWMVENPDCWIEKAFEILRNVTKEECLNKCF
jgi:hypothetical protein